MSMRSCFTAVSALGLQMPHSRPHPGLPVIGRPCEDAGGVPELARGGELAGGR
jgi:hypothetical protein